MNVLLLRPIPGNERFGLGPFFRIEPWGMEYTARALAGRNHNVDFLDLRFTRSVELHLKPRRPRLVGIACMHALEVEDVLVPAHRVRQAAPDAFVVVGGHAAAAYPAPFRVSGIDAICTDEGERAVPLLVEAVEGGRPASSVPGFLVREGR